MKVLQRLDNGQFLTPDYLCFFDDPKQAQECGPDEAVAIQQWLLTIGIKVAIVEGDCRSPCYVRCRSEW